MVMARLFLPDDLWNAIAPLVPPPRSRLKGEGRRIEDRAALVGILFVLRSGFTSLAASFITLNQIKLFC